MCGEGTSCVMHTLKRQRSLEGDRGASTASVITNYQENLRSHSLSSPPLLANAKAAEAPPPPPPSSPSLSLSFSLFSSLTYAHTLSASVFLSLTSSYSVYIWIFLKNYSCHCCMLSVFFYFLDEWTTFDNAPNVCSLNRSLHSSFFYFSELIDFFLMERRACYGVTGCFRTWAPASCFLLACSTGL